MNIEFKVNELYLLMRMLNYYDKDNKEFLKWQKEKATKILGKDLYNKISNISFRDTIRNVNILPELVKKYNLDNKVKELMSTDLFQKYYKENIIYMNNIKEVWNYNQDKLNFYFKNILKNDFSVDLTAYISHYNFNVGVNIGNNTFLFGHNRGVEDSNYNMVYLVHEALHSIFTIENCIDLTKLEDDEDDKKLIHYFNIIHAIIELISDNELYTLLSNESYYNEGHEFLKEYKEKLYPYWFSFLGLSKDEIKMRVPQYDFNQKIRKKFLNINDFIDFCLNLDEEKLTKTR